MNRAIRGFLERRPYEPIGKFEREASEYFIWMRVRDIPPIRWSIIIGEIVHNLRSVLDHLAWQLVKANGCKPNGDTGFPIFTQNPFVENADQRLLGRWERMTGGMHPDDIAFIKEFQPYKRGNNLNAFFILNRLANHDKHRELHFAQNVVRFINIEMFNQRDCRLEPTGKPYHGTFEDSTIVAHYRVVHTGVDPYVEVKAKCTFDVAFGADAGPIKGFSVNETLINLSSAVHDVIHAFAQQRFGSQEDSDHSTVKR